MIKCDKGMLEMKGNGIDLSTEFTMIAHQMINMLCDSGFTREMALDMIDDFISQAKMTDEELMEKAELAEKHLEEIKKSSKSSVSKMMEEILREKK